MFVDKATIFIKSGKGGNGSVSFRREPYIPQGGPDGGNGGKGGDIVIQADRNLRTLMDFRYKRKYEAESGEDGRGRQQFGKDGADLVIKVPVGTVVRDTESNAVMADLTEDGQSFVAAKGGRGGKGNVMFKNSVRQAPNFAEAGGFARERQIELELKLIADVGLVGYPNVGKSTLLSVSTSANPKIANYHFTTITPNLGVVSMYDSSFVMADIPGLIEGASEGAGLGLDFLKHIERTRILIHVVDVSGSEGRDPKEDLDKINAELAGYSEKLAKKPQIVCANKIDMADDEVYEEFKAYAESKGYSVYPCSAPIHEGVDELLRAAYKLLLETEAEEQEETVFFQDTKPEDDPDYRNVYVERKKGGFLVTGKQLEKIFNSTNFNDAGSLRYLYRYIEESGAIEEMLQMGLEEGDTITVIDYDFEYYDE
ncbi:MAG: GTPase ObgE [Firmicutes bacterium]|nr:GTPase ObgE [Bacillota bacterium]MBQ1580552.1 GTPase ObgE [Bacillota bacterium]